MQCSDHDCVWQAVMHPLVTRYHALVCRVYTAAICSSLNVYSSSIHLLPDFMSDNVVKSCASTTRIPFAQPQTNFLELGHIEMCEVQAERLFLEHLLSVIVNLQCVC